MIPKNYTIDQRYTVEKVLGDGLSGEVLLVKDSEGLKALKFLKKVQMNVSREEALQNFKNEFSILKELNHPHISRILDFGFDAKLQKYYLTTEYVSGGDLDTFCAKASLETKEKLIIEVLRALNYLHSRGIFHFDIKPQNILVGHNEQGEPVAKVIDFGLAGYGSPGKKVGTPIYMAPEVIQGGHLDGRTDLYSTGVMIYKILTGVNPFSGKSFQEIAEKQLHFIPEPMTAHNSHIPESWNHIVARLLKKDPNERYAQAAIVIRDFNFLSHNKFEIETKDTKLSYLPEKGTLIARENEWKKCTQLFEDVYEKEQSTRERLLIIEGEKGTGKTRLLSELKAYSQLKNVPVLTLSQYKEQKEHPEKYLLLIDAPHLSVNEVNKLISEHLTKTVLVIWAVETAPKNWSGSQVIHLEPYSKSDLKTYLESVTGLPDAPSVWIDEIYKRTQGNPLFVSEFVKALLDQDLFYDESGKWEVSTFEDVKIDFSKIHIPSSVEDVLKEKFLQLTDLGQNIIAWLAINRSPLHYSDFQVLESHPNLIHKLNHLVSCDFLEYQILSQRYSLKNLVFEDIVNSLLSEEDIRKKHEVLAHHFTQTRPNHVLSLYHQSFHADDEVAKTALLKMSEFHLQNSAFDEAITDMRRYVEIAETHFELKDQNVFMSLGQALTLSGQYQQANQIYIKLIDLLNGDAKSSSQDLLKVYLRCIDVYNKQDLLESVEAFCDKVQSIIDLDQDQKVISMILENYRAHLLFKRGQIESAYERFLSTREQWKHSFSDSEKQAVMNNRLVDIYSVREDYDKAMSFCQENIDVLEGMEHPYDLALNYYAMGDYSYRKSFLVSKTEDKNEIQNLWSTCERSLKSCVEISKKTAHATLLLRAYNGLGNLYYTKNDVPTALDHYKRTLSISQKINDYESSANTAFNIANIYTAQKNYNEAYSYLIFAINTFENLERIGPQSQSILYLSHLSLAEVYYFQDAIEKADMAMQKAKDIFAVNPLVKHYEYWMTIRLALVKAKQNDFDSAKHYYSSAKNLAKTDEEKSDLQSAEEIFMQNWPNTWIQNEGEISMSSPQKSAFNMDSLNRIIEINKVMNSEHDVEQLLNLVLDYAIDLTEAQGGAVLLLDESQNLVVARSKNLNQSQNNPISLSIAKQALKTGEIVEATDAGTDQRFDGSQSIVVNELKSVLCLPICSKQKAVGVFYLDNRLKKNAFQNTDVTLIKAFCDQVGLAIENAKLVSDLKNAKEVLKQDLSRTEEELEEVRHKLHEEVGHYHNSFGKNIISKSKTMNEIFRLMDKVIKSNLAIFIHGESGTGKELIAKALHYNNPSRSKNKFVAINCGAIPSNLMESELFGHKAGSFTGATRDKKGLFEEASGGTLFLDEIGELPLDLQVKLLRVIQEGEVQRIGDHQPIRVDVRVISASHQDLEDMLKKKTFREDLYYRLCQMKLNLPSLRARKEDIPDLVKHFVKKYSKDNSLDVQLEVTSDFLKALLDYDWPGNIRELENLVSVACALNENGRLTLDSLPEHYGINKKRVPLDMNMAVQSTVTSFDHSKHNELVNPIDAEPASHVLIDEKNHYDPRLSWYDYEAIIIAKAFESSGWRKKQVAEWLNMSHSTIYKKIDDYGLDDRKNPLYQKQFAYNAQYTLKDYVGMVFLASLKHHENHPYAAIKVLEISQGYFYKIIKDVQRKNQNTATSFVNQN